MNAVDTPARIAILGAGPIGLEAALYARYLGYDVVVIEAGEVADSVRKWGHVQLFTPFKMNCSPLAVGALSAQAPDNPLPSGDALLTGAEWRDQYLIPLAESDLVVDHVRTRTEVIGVGKETLRKHHSPGSEDRAAEQFRVLTRSADGQESVELADIVIDTTGVFQTPNSAGSGGVPALGETSAAAKIDYYIPNLELEREKFAGRNTLVIGSGYSAATTLASLKALAESHERTTVTWVTAVPAGDPPLTSIVDDALPTRAQLSELANELANNPPPGWNYWPATGVTEIHYEDDKFRVVVSSQTGIHEFDNVIANVGYRGDFDFVRELQVHQCYASEGPMKLAAALLGNPSADCLDQQGTGPATLMNPELNFYILGSKSYGRNSQFLYAIGLQQIRDLFSVIGDREDLDLYATMQVELP